eukprot:163795-Chlamydomonas_euryale.AAC.2
MGAHTRTTQAPLTRLLPPALRSLKLGRRGAWASGGRSFGRRWCVGLPTWRGRGAARGTPNVPASEAPFGCPRSPLGGLGWSEGGAATASRGVAGANPADGSAATGWLSWRSGGCGRASWHTHVDVKAPAAARDIRHALPATKETLSVPSRPPSTTKGTL